MADGWRWFCARGAWVPVVLLAIGLRLGLATQVWGSNDLDTWRFLAQTVSDHGLAATYDHERLLNHPPMAILWAVLCWRIDHLGWGDFNVLMKLPAILADGISCWLLIRAGRTSTVAAIKASLVWALSPVAIGISGYHGNTDNVYAMLALAACLQADAGQSRRAGMLLGLALNIKVIPVLLLPALIASSRSFKEGVKMALGLLLGMTPLLMGVLACGPAMVRNLFGYGSNFDHWGLLLVLDLLGPGRGLADPLAHWYHAVGGRWIMFASVGVAALVSNYRKQSATTSMATAGCLFVVFAPGFGVQYLALPALLLLARQPRAGFYANVLCGLFVWMTYAQFMNHSSRVKSTFSVLIQSPAMYFGLAAWGFLLIAGALLLTRRADRSLHASNDVGPHKAVRPTYAKEPPAPGAPPLAA